MKHAAIFFLCARFVFAQSFADADELAGSLELVKTKAVNRVGALAAQVNKLRHPPIRVAAGASLQVALDAAEPGQTIILDAGAEYRGNFVLRAKDAGDDPIVITTSAQNKLPAGRVGPADAPNMARLVSSSTSPVIATAPGAHHYRLVGLEVTSPVYNYALVVIGGGNDLALLTHHIEIDRMYIHGDAAKGAKRGVQLNARHTSITRSYISDCKGIGQEAQAIMGWNGPGPFEIGNNYLEAAGENIMFGGARNSGEAFIPSDIVIRGNYLYKPLAWKSSDPSYAGAAWSVKNLLELKCARRVLIKDNVLENNWTMAQNGFGVLFTVRTEAGANPWNVVEDVVFEHNRLINSESGINILGTDGAYGGVTRRVRIANNRIAGVTQRAIQLLSGGESIEIENNTILNATSGSLMMFDGQATKGLIFRANIGYRGRYGIVGSGTAEGTATLTKYAPDAHVTGNAIIGAAARASKYPGGNIYPPDVATVPPEYGAVSASR